MLKFLGQRSCNSLPPATKHSGHIASLPKPLPPLELLQELFYVSETSPSGLRWKNPIAYHLKSNQVAGTKVNTGYWRVGIKTDKTRYYVTHRIVFWLKTGVNPEEKQVDHVLGKHNNLNLRVATISENQGNSKKRQSIKGKPCSSKYKGVSWNNSHNRWVAQIQFKKKKMHIGCFKNEIDAATAYNKAAIAYFGEFAKLNEIGLDK